MPSLAKLPRWLFADNSSSPSRLIPRWLFFRALGLIFFSAFYSLLFQVRGLIGPDGLLPAESYLQALKQGAGLARFWYAPTFLWFGASDRALLLVTCIGIVASALLVANLWPRAMVAVCLVCFLSFISTLQAFSSYQSDGMLLGAAFLCLFFAPPGARPRLGKNFPASRASLFLLQWLWFTIYFESGLVKIVSGDPQWRHLTAMDEYYQNGPLPTWIAWYFQHLPHWFHAGTAAFTLILELVLVWMLFLPRRFRIALFWIVTPWQIGIILTSNYAFLNYLVLSLGILLLDDEYICRNARWCLPKKWADAVGTSALAPSNDDNSPLRPILDRLRLWLAALSLTWVFYATAAQMLMIVFPAAPFPTAPVEALEPFRIADHYGLFAVMTDARYEIEFQGSSNGENWIAYPFRYKPQDPRRAPGIYAPYQPRFEWNLWFASLDTWRQNRFVVSAEEHLLENTPDVLSLFATNPFPNGPPREVRAVLWQYWFCSSADRRQGLWWRRQLIGLYAPALARAEDGGFAVTGMPSNNAGLR